MKFLDIMQKPAGRTIRVAVGLSLLASGISRSGVLGAILSVFGVAMAGTAAVGYCPITAILGGKSCSVPASSQSIGQKVAK